MACTRFSLIVFFHSSARFTSRSSWLGLFAAVSAVVAALIGNIIMNPSYLGVFLEYLVPSLLVVMFMLNRTVILKFVLRTIKCMFNPVDRLVQGANTKIKDVIKDINSQEFVFFTHQDDVETLNKVMLYITRNEHTQKLKVVTVLKEGEKVPGSLETDLEVLGREYPKIKIEYIKIKGEFGPGIIHKLSKDWGIPINFMFIGSPDDQFPFEISELGGVRLII